MTSRHLDLRLGAMPMRALLVAQFLSALADNALLVAAIALMKALGQADHVSWVQTGFLVPFVLLAPYVGAVADALPKGRVLLIGNTIKLLGTASMLLGLHPVWSYLLVGVGATLYSPAKYGILVQFFRPDRLVQANALLEGSTILAILLGVVLGGWLTDRSVNLAMWVIVAIYAVAALTNLFIPRLHPVRVERTHWHGWHLLRSFGRSLVVLWRDDAARASLMGTSLFWGSGATLRLMLFAWVPLALHIRDNQTPANMMGILSVGTIVGAMLAWRFIHMDRIRRAFVSGLMIGPCIALLAWQTRLPEAYVWSFALGVSGGVYVVPLNALLQERGRVSVGAGQALAVQNLFENSMMIVMVTAYGFMTRWPVIDVIMGYGVAILAGTGVLAVLAGRVLRRNADTVGVESSDTGNN